MRKKIFLFTIFIAVLLTGCAINHRINNATTSLELDSSDTIDTALSDYTQVGEVDSEEIVSDAKQESEKSTSNMSLPGSSDSVISHSESEQQPSTTIEITQQPTTQSVTTQQPTTQSATTQQPTTQSATTKQPTTQSTTTKQPTTQSTTTKQPTTQSATTQSATTKQPTTQVFANKTEYAKEIVRLVNVERKKAGLQELSFSVQLCNAADTIAGEIPHKFSHERLDGSRCYTAIKEVGASYTRAGENIARGQATPKQAVDAWMASESHRKNIMNPNFTKTGVGYLEYQDRFTYYWVQFFTD